MGRLRTWVSLWLLPCAAWASTGRILFAQAPASIPLAVSGGPFVLQRQLLDGGAVAAGAPGLDLNLSSTSPTGQFAPARGGAWSATLPLTIPPGAAVSPPFYYRDGNAGAPELWVDAGMDDAGFSSDPAETPVVISTTSVTDDFEMGSPSPAWSAQYVGPNNGLAVTSAAAHRGSYGMRAADLGARDAGDYADLFLDVPPRTGDFYVRAWIRLVDAGPGDTNILNEGAPGQALMDFNLRSFPDSGDPFVRIGGYVASGAYVLGSSSSTFALDGWHLVEVAMQGVGTPDGGLQAWVDGTSVYGRDHRDWSTFLHHSLYVGQTYEALGGGRPDFAGLIDYDDFRSGSEPLASRLGVQGGPIGLGACSALELALLEPSGSLAAAPYPVAAFVVLSSGEPVFADPACVTPQAAVTIPEGMATAGFYVRPSQAGSLSASASHPDFLPGTASWSVGPGETRLNVGCGCHEAGGLEAALGVSWALALVAAKRRAARTA